MKKAKKKEILGFFKQVFSVSACSIWLVRFAKKNLLLRNWNKIDHCSKWKKKKNRRKELGFWRRNENRVFDSSSKTKSNPFKSNFNWKAMRTDYKVFHFICTCTRSFWLTKDGHCVTTVFGGRKVVIKQDCLTTNFIIKKSFT
jgi:hypothetical protein